MKNKLLFPILILALSLLTACNMATSPQSSTAIATQLAIPTQNNQAEPVGTPQLASPSLESLQMAYEQVYQNVLPSVVNIQATRTVNANAFQLPADINPFGLPDSDQIPQTETVLGSGFVWDAAGHIVTNNHVVENADAITVTFSDSFSTTATLIGTDVDSDLAVIKVDLPPEKLTPIQVTDSTQVKVGQIAIAIGNPFGLSGTMTTGIISALGRSLPVDASTTTAATYTIPDVIQTDAPINPGNSGGVLVDINGKLIGVTTAIQSSVRSNAGIGFVVPAIIVQKVVPSLIASGNYQHTWLGISGRTMTAEQAQAMNLNPDQHGVLVITVDQGGPAEKAGILGSGTETKINNVKTLIGGDIIVKIENQPINDFEDLAAYLARYTEVGQTIQLEILRNGNQKQLSVTLQARPKESNDTQSPSKGQVVGKSWLGIQGVDLTSEIASAMQLAPNTRGVLIVQVSPNSPAQTAGLRGGNKTIKIFGQEVQIGGDIIAKVDDQVITGISQLKNIIDQTQPNTKVKLEIIRENKIQSVEVILLEKPSSY